MTGAIPPIPFLANDTILIAPGQAPPGNVYNITRSALNNQLVALFLNGVFLVNPLHYTISGRQITLASTTGLGDNLYASYMATTYS